MDGADGNLVGKRRFPSWMLGVANPEKVKEPREGVVNRDLADAPVRKIRKTVSRTRAMDSREESMLREKEPDEETLCVAKRETKRKRLSGRTIDQAAPQKRQMKKNMRLRSIQESDELSDSDDDEELTMEDMMSIANEYVTADENIIRQLTSNRDCEEEIQLQSKASSSNVSRSSFSDPQTNERLEFHQKSGSFSPCDGLANKGVIPSISTTGDPAQDMLNLLLGPLLNKPIEEEKKHKSFTENMPFVSQYRINSQNASSGEPIVTLMKKKSSLKDTVAMLLH